MPVLSVVSTVDNFPVLRHTACKFGMALDVIDQTPTEVYVDMAGDPYRMLTVAIRGGAKPLCIIPNIEHGEVVKVYPDRPAH